MMASRPAAFRQGSVVLLPGGPGPVADHEGQRPGQFREGFGPIPGSAPQAVQTGSVRAGQVNPARCRNARGTERRMSRSNPDDGLESVK
jgi:hypothetical protein